MSAKSWLTYSVVFVAGALVVGGVWTVVTVIGNQQAPTATPSAAISSGGVEAEVTETQAATAAPAERITPIGSVQRNQMVTIFGTVDRVTDEDEFFLRDDSGSIKVWTGNSFFTVQPGERIQVSGFVDDDLLIEVYATEIVKESGDVIQISGYTAQ